MTPEEANREIELLRQDLENTRQAKNHEIIELKHALSRAEIRIKNLQERCTFLQAEERALSQKYRELELYSKERSRALTQKNHRINQLEQTLQQAVRQKEVEMQGHIDKQRFDQSRLLDVIRGQEEELSVYLSDHQNYVEQFERVAVVYRKAQAETNLLADYNAELEKQIEEVETTNSSLENWVSCAYAELSGQNEQAGDLLSQVEYMMDSIAPERE